jgi:hypothetical protein
MHSIELSARQQPYADEALGMCALSPAKQSPPLHAPVLLLLTPQPQENAANISNTVAAAARVHASMQLRPLLLLLLLLTAASAQPAAAAGAPYPAHSRMPTHQWAGGKTHQSACRPIYHRWRPLLRPCLVRMV